MQSVAGIVAITFVVLAVIVSWVLGHGLHWTFLTMGVIDTPLLGDNFTVTTLLGAVASFATALVCWRHPTVNLLSQEVVQELKKVTWPSPEETRVATVVVIATSVVVSLILGTFDLGFNWVIQKVF